MTWVAKKNKPSVASQLCSTLHSASQICNEVFPQLFADVVVAVQDSALLVQELAHTNPRAYICKQIQNSYVNKKSSRAINADRDLNE